MDTMNIELPESMKQFVQSRVDEGDYGSTSEYFQDLIRADQLRKAKTHLESLLIAGLDSGEPIPATQDYWDEKKRKLTTRSRQATRPR